MPGSGRRWEWKRKPPLYWTVLAVIFFFADFLWLANDFILEHIAPQIPDPVRSHAVSASGKTYYVQPWLAWFHDSGAWLLGSIFFILVLIMVLKRNQVERVR